MSAVRGGSVEAVAILLNGGVNPFHTNGLGQSAMDLAKIYWPRTAIPYCIEQAISQWNNSLKPAQIQTF